MRRAALLRVMVIVGWSWVAIATAGIQANAQAVSPVVKDYGPAWPLPNAAVQPDKNQTYKMIFDLTRPSGDPKETLEGLDHAARTMNVFATLGVPASNLRVALIFHGPATYAAMDNAVYRAKFKVDNPNIKLLSELKDAGAEIYVCGQALRKLKLEEKNVTPDVKVATAAMVVLVVYQHQGYALMPF